MVAVSSPSLEVIFIQSRQSIFDEQKAILQTLTDLSLFPFRIFKAFLSPIKTISVPSDEKNNVPLEN